MRICANPLVVAAALGLLGPAALAEDDPEEKRGVEGLWARVATTAPASHRLGDRIEVVPVEDRLLFIDRSAGAPAGEWIRLEHGLVRQELLVGGSRVVRELRADGDELAVVTLVEGDDDGARYLDRYARVG